VRISQAQAFVLPDPVMHAAAAAGYKLYGQVVLIKFAGAS
jgi:hypothetical protein